MFFFRQIGKTNRFFDFTKCLNARVGHWPRKCKTRIDILFSSFLVYARELGIGQKYGGPIVTDQRVGITTNIDTGFLTVPRRKQGGGGARGGYRISTYIAALTEMRSDPHIGKGVTNGTTRLRRVLVV